MVLQMKQSIRLPRNKKISLIVCDCDGTILDEKKNLDSGLKNVVGLLKKKKIDFSLASGRNYYLIRPFVDELRIDLPYITDNGGNIYQGEQRLVNNILPPEALPAIAAWLYHHDLPFLIYTDCSVYINEATETLQHFADRLNGLMNLIPYSPQIDFAGETSYKITVDSAEQGTMPGLVQAFFETFPDVNIKPSEGKLYTITSPEATKANALKQLADSLSVPLSEVMVFGDNHNDISMIEEAGWGVAVSNGEPDAVEAADDLCGSNDDNGVSEYLKIFIKEYTN